MMGGIKRFAILCFILLAIDASVVDVPFLIRNRCIRAFVDNAGHFISALISWLMVRSVNGFLFADKLVWMESLVCGMISSLTDVDHFIQAMSTSLVDATSLPFRPFMHCSSLALLIVIVTLLSSLIFGIWWLHSLSFIAFVAWTTHHLRDGLRRGIWFWPLGSTKAIDYKLYLLCILLLPIVTSYLFDLTGALVLSTNNNGPSKRRSLEFSKNRRKNSSLEKDMEASTTLLSQNEIVWHLCTVIFVSNTSMYFLKIVTNKMWSNLSLSLWQQHSLV